MYLQGDLQRVFDALFELGVIDPVLEMDWSQALEEMHNHWEEFSEAVATANRHQGDPDILRNELQKLNPDFLNYLAIEVAKEFADYHSRDDLH